MTGAGNFNIQIARKELKNSKRGHVIVNNSLQIQNRTDFRAGNQFFDASIQRCCTFNKLPSLLNLKQLNKGHGIAETLQYPKAKL